MQVPPGQRYYGQGGEGAAPPPAVEPEVVPPGQRYPHPAPTEQYLPIFPEFTSLTRRLDQVARRIPWWLWLVAGFLSSRWLRKRGGIVLPG